MLCSDNTDKRNDKMEYNVRIYLNEKNGNVYAYSTEIFGKDIMEASKIVERHVSNFKKSTKFNVGIYNEDGKLMAGYTSTTGDWFFNKDDDE